MSPQRGLTLLEVLVSLALLVAVAAVATPFLLRDLDDRAFASSRQSVLDHLLHARAYAQQTGRPIEVVFDPHDRTLRARYFEVAPLGSFGIPVTGMTGRDADAPAIGGNARRELSGNARNTAAAGDLYDLDERRIAASWAVRKLKRGMKLSDEPPAAMDDPEGRWLDFDEFAMLEEDALLDSLESRERRLTMGDFGDETVRLAIYLPDGSALFAADAWLTDGDRRIARLHINPWSGVPELQSDPIGHVDEDDLDADEFDEDEIEDDLLQPQPGFAP